MTEKHGNVPIHLNLVHFSVNGIFCLLNKPDHHLEGRFTQKNWGWSGGAMVLGKLPVPGRPTILITVGQGPIALAVGAGGGCMDIFTLIYPFSSFSLSLGDGSI